MVHWRVVWRRGAAMAVVLVSLGIWLAIQPPQADTQEQAKQTNAAPSPEAAAAVPLEPVHQFHIDDVGMDCTDCHAAPDTSEPGDELRLSVRPNHEVCGDCHDDIAEPEDDAPICRTCHVDAKGGLATYPAGQTTLKHFSHAAHVDPQGRMNAQSVRRDCVFCHTADATQRIPKRAGHPQCGACHNGDNAVKPVLEPEADSETCVGCHALEKIDTPLTARQHSAMSPATSQTATSWVTASGVPYRDIVPFPHHRHMQRRDGAAIDCVTCHSAVLDRSALGAHAAVPAMETCATCHDKARWVGQTFLTKQCRVCHEDIPADLRPQLVDPVSQPIVHTEGFRRFHKIPASAPDSKCQYCHDGAVNAQIDGCAGCHNSMAPRSHLALRFNETVHGRHAAFDRQTCATCHTSSFCISCHQVPPRSHQPLQAFRAGAHRQIATLNLRSCFVCHQFEPTCAECHERQLRR